MHRLTALIVFFLLNVFNNQAVAIHPENLLPAEKAFRVQASALSDQQVQISWDIEDGYYLYRNKLGFESQTPSVTLMPAQLPDGKIKHDEFFGDVEIYRGQLNVILPLQPDHQQDSLTVQVKYQGCADIGICYPPQKKSLTVALPQAATGSLDKLLQNLGNIPLNLFEDELLPAEQAFRFFASVKDPQTLQLQWIMADGYYLYRDKIALSIAGENNTQIGHYRIPRGEPYHDEAFGDVEIYHQELTFDLPLQRQHSGPHSITLTAEYQGCADRGVCYPPMKTTTVLELPVAQQLTPIEPLSPAQLSEQDQIVRSLQQDTLLLTLLSFFGFGLLLAFTPCVFPMIPILSGIIVGHSKSMTTRRAFMLSFSYVLATALTYTTFGILAALFGSNLQATFQNPWIIASFSAVFVLLSLSMFGFYELQLPAFIQNRLHHASDKFRGSSYAGAFILGILSSLIVGPCVAAPLAAALIYIGKTGDVILGGSALFSMGMGMGAPLLLIGASAGKLLPRAGKWLNSTKTVFGIIMLAVAIWMLERIIPASVSMLLWAALLIIPSIYLSAIDPLPQEASNWRRLWKGVGLIMLVYGILLLIGVSAGNDNPLQPLKGLASNNSAQSEQGIQFTRIRNSAELDTYLQQASNAHQPVMLEFSADWCISCKEMEAYTFSDPAVKQQLQRFVLLQVDVTANNDDDKALLRRFNLIGPPGVIFFGPDRKEIKSSRVIGFQDAQTFSRILQTI